MARDDFSPNSAEFGEANVGMGDAVNASLATILADGIYIGGGVLIVVLIVVIVLLILRG